LCKVFDSNEISLDLACKLLIPQAIEWQSLDSIAFESIFWRPAPKIATGKPRVFTPIVNYNESDRERCHADVLALQLLRVLRGLTCDFWAENAEKNARPTNRSRSPFDYAQGRLYGMTTRKARQTEEAER
jgi:hypothetical protein